MNRLACLDSSQRDAVRREFLDDMSKPPGLLVVGDFLRSDVADRLYTEMISVAWERYSVTMNREVGGGFLTPLESEPLLLSMESGRQPTATMLELYEHFSGSGLAAVRDCFDGSVSAFKRTGDYGTSFHRMGPGDFMQFHTDHCGPDFDTKIVINLSMTKGWNAGFGGATEYRWGGRRLVTEPTFNTAVIFGPHESSFHRVFQLTPHAPWARYNCTFEFR